MDSDASSHSTSHSSVKEDMGDSTVEGTKGVDLSLEDNFKKIASSTDRDKLQKKYDKLKRIYLKLKQKYLEKEEQKKHDISSKPVNEESVEVITIKDEVEDGFYMPAATTEFSPTPVNMKRNLSVTPEKKQAERFPFEETAPTKLSSEGKVDEPSRLELINGKKTGGRRKSTRPRKTEEKVESNGEIHRDEDEDTQDYLPLNSDAEDDNDTSECLAVDDGLCLNDEDEPEMKKRKKNNPKADIRVKLKDKNKEKDKKEPQIFRCSVCGKFLSSKPILEKHHRIHTGERPYQCHICGKSFNSLSSFNNHTRIHNGIKPYQCRHCEKCFTETSQRTTHERTHTGEKPYMCDLCGGRFSLRSSLVRHRRIHTGEKPYVCSDCGAAYCQYTQLSHHKKKCGRFSILPTMTPLRYQASLTDTTYEKTNMVDRPQGNSLAEGTSYPTDLVKNKPGEKNSKEETSEQNLSGGKEEDKIKLENVTDSSKIQPQMTNNSDVKRHSKSAGLSHGSDSFLPQLGLVRSERDAMFHNSVSNFQHFQPYVHALNSSVTNISSFPSPEVVAREAMERFSSMHPSWFVNNTQTG